MVAKLMRETMSHLTASRSSERSAAGKPTFATPSENHDVLADVEAIPAKSNEGVLIFLPKKDPSKRRH